MTSLAAALADLLGAVDRPGGFCSGGTMDLFAPGLEVDGVGSVALPLLPAQREQLVAVAEQAPYGRGTETLLDTAVRRTWQIGADKVRLTGRHWPATLSALVERVAEGLGVSGPVTAELYKLLVYDEGGFFVSHRDTEKADGMFATLVLVLPSRYSGGELIVRHQGQEQRFDLRCSDPAEAAFAAFYTDCVHEVLPVTSGCRLTLIFNLTRRGQVLQPPRYDTQRERLATLLRDWPADGPAKLVYLLEHVYTEAALSFADLKGVDAVRAATVAAAAEAADCDLHLALLTIEESGSAEYTGDSRRWHADEDEDFEVGEVFDRSELLSHWCRCDGLVADLGKVPLEQDEVSPPGALDDLEPDDETFTEATGNAGASFDRLYRRAALVLWPRRRRLAVFNQGGLSVTLPALETLAERWATEGQPVWDEAHELAGHMLATWDAYQPQPDKASNAGRMLAALTRLGDQERIEATLGTLMPAGQYGLGDNPAIIAALGLLEPQRAVALVCAIVSGNAERALGPCGDLLKRATKRYSPAALRPAAETLRTALPGDPARDPAVPSWQLARQIPAPGDFATFLAGLDAVDPGLAEAAVLAALDRRKLYGLDELLIPAALSLGAAAPERLRAACIEHLRTRTAEPLEAPRDWRRDAVVSCKCANCVDLNRFLADPARETWSLRAVEQDRSHVEESIRRHQCDVDTHTERRGRPYTLVCTKTQASYQRRTRQRTEDLHHLTRLEQSGT